LKKAVAAASSPGWLGKHEINGVAKFINSADTSKPLSVPAKGSSCIFNFQEVNVQIIPASSITYSFQEPFGDRLLNTPKFVPELLALAGRRCRVKDQLTRNLSA